MSRCRRISCPHQVQAWGSGSGQVQGQVQVLDQVKERRKERKGKEVVLTRRRVGGFVFFNDFQQILNSRELRELREFTGLKEFTGLRAYALQMRPTGFFSPFKRRHSGARTLSTLPTLSTPPRTPAQNFKIIENCWNLKIVEPLNLKLGFVPAWFREARN